MKYTSVPATLLLLLLISCVATKNFEHPSYLFARPDFLWSDIAVLDSACCERVAIPPAGSTYPPIDFRLREPGGVRVELLCQNGSLLGTLFDSTLGDATLYRFCWGGHDLVGRGGQECIFKCRVTSPDTEFVINYGPPFGYPNPFSAGTIIPFTLTDSGLVSILMYNVNGVIVRHLVDSVAYPAGAHQVAWEGKDDSSGVAPSGVYFYRLYIGDSVVATKKMTLLN